MYFYITWFFFHFTHIAPQNVFKINFQAFYTCLSRKAPAVKLAETHDVCSEPVFKAAHNAFSPGNTNPLTGSAGALQATDATPGPGASLPETTHRREAPGARPPPPGPPSAGSSGHRRQRPPPPLQDLVSLIVKGQLFIFIVQGFFFPSGISRRSRGGLVGRGEHMAAHRGTFASRRSLRGRGRGGEEGSQQERGAAADKGGRAEGNRAGGVRRGEQPGVSGDPRGKEGAGLRGTGGEERPEESTKRRAGKRRGGAAGTAGLAPTWHRHTMSDSVASRSTTLPLPSSPHCAPNTTVTLLPPGSLRARLSPPPGWLLRSLDARVPDMMGGWAGERVAGAAAWPCLALRPAPNPAPARCPRRAAAARL